MFHGEGLKLVRKSKALLLWSSQKLKKESPLLKYLSAFVEAASLGFN